MKTKDLALLALGAAALYLFMRGRGADPGGRIRNQLSDSPRGTDPTDALLGGAKDRFTKLEKALKDKPGLGAILGLSQSDIDRIILPAKDFEARYFPGTGNTAIK